jgi:hypothetical protein
MRALVKPSDRTPATNRYSNGALAPLPTEDVMDVTHTTERRRVQRHRTLKAGSIAFNRAGGIDCRVRNLSPVGACLEVASQVGIPDDFVLVIDTNHLTQPCHVIWRKEMRLGVAFGS